MQLVIANNREYFSRVDARMHADEIERWRREDNILAMLAAWWPTEEALCLLPAIPPASVQSALSTLLLHAPEYWPCGASDQGVCAQLLSDETALDGLARRLAGVPVEPLLWAAEPRAYALLAALTSRGVDVRCDELPLPGALDRIWQSDSKAGFRSLAETVEVRLPPGMICESDEEIRRAIDKLLPLTGGVLVKANRSVGGWGHAGFTTVPDAALLRSRLARSGVWSGEPVVVESHLRVVRSPTVEALIDPDGQTSVLVVADQLLDESRACIGAVCGADQDPSEGRVLRDAVAALGSDLARLGMRGRFNCDFVVTPTGQVYATEVNLRRSTVSPLTTLLDGSSRVAGKLYLWHVPPGRPELVPLAGDADRVDAAWSGSPTVP